MIRAVLMIMVIAATAACGGSDPGPLPASTGSSVASPSIGGTTPGSRVTPSPSGPPEPQGPLADEFERTGRAHFDLTRELTPATAGLAVGETSVRIARTPPAPIVTTLAFGTGEPLVINANQVVVTLSTTSRNTAGGTSSLTVGEQFAGLKPVHDRLVALTNAYQLDPETISIWWKEARAATNGQATAPQFFEGRRGRARITLAVLSHRDGDPAHVDWFVDW